MQPFPAFLHSIARTSSGPVGTARRRFAIAAALVASALLPLTVAAQSWTCLTVGAPQHERLDRDDHSLRVNSYSCRVSGGALDGFVATATNIWEFERGAARLLAATGVLRKPGAAVVYQGEGSQELIVAHGKPMGWTSAGTGVFKLATGSAAALAGKSFTFAARPEGTSVFTIETAVRD